MKLIWNGTSEERLELLAAGQRNCTCINDVKGARLSCCEAHTIGSAPACAERAPVRATSRAALHLRSVAPGRSRGHWLEAKGDAGTVRIEPGPAVRRRRMPKSRTRFGKRQWSSSCRLLQL